MEKEFLGREKENQKRKCFKENVMVSCTKILLKQSRKIRTVWLHLYMEYKEIKTKQKQTHRQIGGYQRRRGLRVGKMYKTGQTYGDGRLLVTITL